MKWRKFYYLDELLYFRYTRILIKRNLISSWKCLIICFTSLCLVKNWNNLQLHHNLFYKGETERIIFFFLFLKRSLIEIKGLKGDTSTMDILKIGILNMSKAPFLSHHDGKNSQHMGIWQCKSSTPKKWWYFSNALTSGRKKIKIKGSI